MICSKAFRTVMFVLFTVIVILGVVFLDSIPNHRYNDGDYDMWLAITMFPIIFFTHGVVSGLILQVSQKRVYIIATLFMVTISFFLNRLIVDGMNVKDSLLTGSLCGVVYTIISVVGMLIYLGIERSVTLLLRMASRKK